MKIPIMQSWRFHRGDVKRWERVDHDICYMTTKAGYEIGDRKVFIEQNEWETIDLPHDWSTQECSREDAYPDNGFKHRGKGWYYCEFEVPAQAEDMNVCLEFEGVMGETVVYVNGVLAQRSESGYTPFVVDISDYVLSGEMNMVALEVDNSRWEGWWYEGAGIYRPVYLHISPKTHFAYEGLFAKPVKTNNGWKVMMQAEAEGEEDSNIQVIYRILDAEGACVSETAVTSSVSAYEKRIVRAECVVEDPELWSINSPVLYTMECILYADGVQIDRQSVRFGFREIAWTDRGMYINDEKVPVRGICCHQDHVGVGIAVGKSLIRYRISKLKAMGCNAYRCAHNPPSKDLLDVCDELGMLVMAENRHFRSSDEVLAQVDALVRLSRNHPSVFLYSLFNEEPWQCEPRGRKIAERLQRRIRLLDDSRAITAAMNGGALTKENASDVLDVAGLNYFIEDYNKYAERCPGKPMLGTENGPLYATRGIYKDDAEKQLYDSYGLTTAPFGQLLQDTIEHVEAAPHVAGQFVWGGFDYRGEPQPFEWPSVFSHWGLSDNCGFEKDTFFMLKSYYSDQSDKMLHLLPHWNWEEGETVRVCAMTNCERVQLFVNGKAWEEKTVVRNRAEWEVPFELGVIKAVAYSGDVVLEDERRTADKPAALAIVDAADDKDYDCSIINVCLMDANGIPVPNRDDDRMVHATVRCGKIIGVGNGDPNGIQPDVSEDIMTFCGRCQVLVRPDHDGKVDVDLCSPGLPLVSYKRG